NGAYRSTNGGLSFARLSHAPFSAVIAASHARAKVAIATDANDVPWRSTDGGVTWTPLAQYSIRFMQFLAGSSDSALAMRGDDHLMRTPDSGATWTDLGLVPNGRIWGMASDPANPNHVV